MRIDVKDSIGARERPRRSGPQGLNDRCGEIPLELRGKRGTVVAGNVGGAMVWGEGHGILGIKTVLESDWGLDLKGWGLVYAEGISDDKTTFVGYGTNPDGHLEGWIAHIPAVSEWGMIVMTLSLLMVGTLVLKRRHGFRSQSTESSR